MEIVRESSIVIFTSSKSKVTTYNEVDLRSYLTTETWDDIVSLRWENNTSLQNLCLHKVTSFPKAVTHNSVSALFQPVCTSLTEDTLYRVLRKISSDSIIKPM